MRQPALFITSVNNADAQRQHKQVGRSACWRLRHRARDSCSCTRRCRQPAASRARMFRRQRQCADEKGAGRAGPHIANSPPKLRWIVNGLTVLNNKGKPVKQYEPGFSKTRLWLRARPQPKALRPSCITTRRARGAHRDARLAPSAGSSSRRGMCKPSTRTTRYWSRAGIGSGCTTAERGVPLHQPKDSPQTKLEAEAAEALAQNATVQDKRAAKQSLAHQDTPALTILDSLGREVIAIAHNRVEDTNGPHLMDGSTTGRALPHLHQARRRRQAAVDSRRARQPGDAVHHAAQTHAAADTASRPQ